MLRAIHRKKLTVTAAVLALSVLLGACGVQTGALHTQDPHEGMIQVSDGIGGYMWVREYEELDKNTFSAADFSEEDGMLCFSGEGYTALSGIDVSFYQGEIDWNAVAADGIEFAVIRAGYRGCTEGGISEDERFRENMLGALDAGLKVGVYFFSQAVNAAEAEEEADFLLDLISGYDVTLPVMFDWEHIGNGTPARTDSVSGETLTECALAFCEKVAGAGYSSGVYFYPNLGYLEYDLGQLAGLTFWLSEPGNAPSFWYAHEMWQYSYSGRVAGIEGEADLNMYFVKDKTA